MQITLTDEYVRDANLMIYDCDDFNNFLYTTVKKRRGRDEIVSGSTLKY